MVLLRSFISWLLALGFLLLAVGVAATLFFGNFIVAWQSFLAQGWEQTPLGHVPFLGAWAQGFGVGAAPIAALWALVVTGAMNYTVLAANKNIAEAVRSLFDQRQVLRSDDAAMHTRAADYRDAMIEHGVRAAALIVLCFFIIRYDVNQFRLRSESLVTGASDPTEMLRWAPDAVARLGQFFADFVGTATWGYAACIIATALALEFAIGRAALRWQALLNAVDAAASAEDQAAIVQAHGSPENHEHGEAPAISTAEPVDDGRVRQSDTPDAIDPEPVSPPAPVDPPPAQPTHGESPSVKVIIGPGRTQEFPLADVQADPEHFVRDGSGRVWFTRSYWSQVTSGSGDVEAS